MRIFIVCLLTALFSIILGCASYTYKFPRPDVSTFNPGYFDLLAQYTYKVHDPKNQIVGTAFAIKIGSYRFLVTNAHVCSGSLGMNQRLIAYQQVTEGEYFTTPLVVDKEHDLCFMSAPYFRDDKNEVVILNNAPAIPVSIGVTDEVDGRKPGDTYLTCGHPAGGNLRFESFVDIGDSEISTVNESPYCELAMTEKPTKETREKCTTAFQGFRLSRPCIPGQSGSAIINNQGVLVGVVQATDAFSCYAIPSEYLITDLREMLKR